MLLLLCLGAALDCAALQVSDGRAAARPLVESAAGQGGKAGASEKSTKNVLPFLWPVEAGAAAAKGLSCSDAIELLAATASKLTKNA